ncbi:hypothetical protein C8R43DRAFT_1230698 [Mycena crocata]|nr:hypothetical protein C8R43DRAFT_1102482 [Mycena crocata]KAJ7173908.1 hypothetical protein C8R43DRAFT_1230698 [Mycena crocata]
MNAQNENYDISSSFLPQNVHAGGHMKVKLDMCGESSRSTYTPRVPVFNPAALRAVRYSSDPHALHCTETLGDGRIGYEVADLFYRIYPHTSPTQFKRVLDYILSNDNFQRIGNRLGMDDNPVDDPEKAAGNALEIFFEIFGKDRPKAGQHWIGDLFTPLLDSAMQPPSAGTTQRYQDSHQEKRQRTEAPKILQRGHTSRPQPKTRKSKNLKVKKKTEETTSHDYIQPSANVNPGEFPTCEFTFLGTALHISSPST